VSGSVKKETPAESPSQASGVLRSRGGLVGAQALGGPTGECAAKPASPLEE
jgi:hypothetical protein